MNNDDKVMLTFKVGEIKEMLLPLYEFSIFATMRKSTIRSGYKGRCGYMQDCSTQSKKGVNE